MGREIEHVPHRLEGSRMSHVLPRIRRLIQELGTPKMSDTVARALKYVEHRLLRAFMGLAVVVAVVVIAG